MRRTVTSDARGARRLAADAGRGALAFRRFGAEDPVVELLTRGFFEQIEQFSWSLLCRQKVGTQPV